MRFAANQVKSDKHTMPLGPIKASLAFDKWDDGSELVKINLHIEKRKGHPLRTVALPLRSYEPWADYLLRCFDKLGENDHLIPYNRIQLSRIIRRYGFVERANTDGRKNPLRHVRLNHLQDFYRFSPMEATVFAGWDMKTAVRSFGGSPMLSEYSHSRWREYLPPAAQAPSVGSVALRGDFRPRYGLGGALLGVSLSLVV